MQDVFHLPTAIIVTAVFLLVQALLWLRRRQARRGFLSDADRITYETLRAGSQAGRHLRAGLTEDNAGKAARNLRVLLGGTAVAVCDTQDVLVWSGHGEHHRDQAMGHAGQVLDSGDVIVLGRADLPCDRPDCDVRAGVAAPLVVEDRVIGALTAYSSGPSAGLARATEQLATWVSGQLELGELDRERTRAMEAELRSLRAQISPHFIYNSLGAIASFVRTDPDRARELLLEFADFTRYSFRRHGDFTTLAEELRSVERYLLLEQARFGDRLRVTLSIAPEVLPVAVPFLCIQPLVENAVRHGLESVEGGGHIRITARDQDQECLIEVEDDGVGLPVDRDRIVEPYVTTRARGTGLGLAIVKKIVEEHFGTIARSDRH